MRKRAFGIAVCALLLASCAGGGSSETDTPAPGPVPGAFSPAAPGGYGANATPHRIATGSTPAISTAPDDTAFPLLQTAIGYSPNGAGPVDWVNDGGASLTLSSSSPSVDALLATSSSTHALEVVSGSASSGQVLYGASDTGNDYSVSASLLDHTAFGIWAIDTKGNPSGTAAAFTTGYETFAPAMPVTGTASYAGTATGLAVDANGTYRISGDASLSVNFGNGAVGGNLSNMTVTAGGVPAAWNTVHFDGTLSGSGFSGNATTPTTSTGPAGIAAGSTGSVEGQFYGPSAEEAAGVWTLSDGNVTAIGAFGGAR